MTTPCHHCGGEKPEGKGRRYCDACKAILYWPDGKTQRRNVPGRKFKAVAKPCNRCGEPKVPPGEQQVRGQKYCAPCKVITQAIAVQKRKDAYVAHPRAKRPPKPIPAKPVRVVMVKGPKTVSAEIRSAWGRADRNSIIKRKYPTMASLIEGLGT